jgi:hemerythrin
LRNGFVEGKNHRTKAIMRQAYGYRNHRHVRLRTLLEVAVSWILAHFIRKDKNLSLFLPLTNLPYMSTI